MQGKCLMFGGQIFVISASAWDDTFLLPNGGSQVPLEMLFQWEYEEFPPLGLLSFTFLFNVMVLFLLSEQSLLLSKYNWNILFWSEYYKFVGII